MSEDRLWRLACGALAVSVFAMLLDAFSESFTISTGFWTFLAALMGFLGAVATVKLRDGNGKR